MAQEVINIGALADDGTGDTIRRTGIKINNNFTELYARSSVSSDIRFTGNKISSTASNANIVLKPAGTGSIVFPGITFEDNTIKSNRTNDDLKIVPSGTGLVIVDGIGFIGTSMSATDSATVNVNENLSVDGTINASTPTFTSALTANSTLGVTGATTLSTLTVSGASSFAGTTTIDNLTFNDNIIATSSNADLNLTPGGTGVVNVSNLTIDSSINLTDNVIKVTRSNDHLVLSASGTGSVVMSKADVNDGAIDNTTIGGTTPATSTFTTVNATTLNADGVVITDNTITTTSNADLELTGEGTGTVSFNGIKFPTSDGSANQVLQTNGSGQLVYFTSPILFDVSDITDGTNTITGNSVAQTFDTFSTLTYRGAKYLVQISDATNNRYSLIELNVTHDASEGVGNAYISVFGGVDNGTGDGSTAYDSLEFTAIVNGGDVRVRAKVNNTTTQTLKFVRRIFKL